MKAAAVDLVHRAFAAWNAGDWETLAGLTDPHAEMRPVLGAPENTVFFGLEGVRAYRETAEKLLGRLTAEPEQVLRADDERVLVVSHVCGRGAPSGVEIDQHFVYLFTIRDSRIAGLQSFASEAEALATLSPEEEPPRPPMPSRAAPPSPGEAARARPGA